MLCKGWVVVVSGMLCVTAVDAGAQVDISRLVGLKARNVGPAGMSGRIGAVEAVVSDPDIMYAGAGTGGLWKSTTGGVTWQPIMDEHPAASIGAIAVFQPAPDIVWVGTGEKARRNSAGVGTGIYKSMDGGITWRSMGLNDSEVIAEILTHPTDPQIVYVAVLGKTWADGEQRGVYKTTNGGQTWSRMLFVNQRTGAADLVMDPSNPDKLIAAMWEHRRRAWSFSSGGPGSGLHISYDGGVTWDQLGPDDGLPGGELGRVGLAIAPSDASIVYALVEAEKSVLLRSADGGHTWETVNDDENIASRPFYYAQLRVDPRNENRVFNVHSLLDMSEDGGRTFSTLLPFARVHPDHHALWIHPDGRLMIDGNDGGISISWDAGASWRFVENLPLAQFYHISVDNATPYNIYGGLQDNGSWRGPSQVWETGGIRYYHWQEINFGDGFAALVDGRNTRYAYAQSQGGFLVRSDLQTGERKNIRPAHPDGVPLRFNWNAALNIDPFENALYYGSQFVHRSRNGGLTWNIISPDLTTNDPAKQRQLESGGLTYDVTGAENHTTIVTIAPSSVEQGVVWVGTDDGNVQVTRDDGTTWTNVVGRIRGVPSNTWVSHIEASKFEGGSAFVVFDDHRRSNSTPYVYRTTDYGRSWRSLATDNIEGFVHVVEQDPLEPDLLFLGTEFGLYISFDGGSGWQQWTNGVPRVPVRAIVVHPSEHDLVIGTHGRAAYVLDDIRPLRAMVQNPSIIDAPLHVFNVPAVIQYRAFQARGMRFLADAKYVGENRAYGSLITFVYNSTAESDSLKAEVLIEDQSGRAMRRFEVDVVQGVNRIVWDLRRDGVMPVGSEDEYAPSGSMVLPGNYWIQLSVGGRTSNVQPVEVRPDPRIDISDEDRIEKDAALRQIEGYLTFANEALDRLDRIGKAVANVEQRFSSETDSNRVALRDRAGMIQSRVDELRSEFAGPVDLQGIVRRPDAVTAMLNSVNGSLGSSWDKPTEAQLIYLQQAELRLRDVIDRLNEFVDTDS